MIYVFDPDTGELTDTRTGKVALRVEGEQVLNSAGYALGSFTYDEVLGPSGQVLAYVSGDAVYSDRSMYQLAGQLWSASTEIEGATSPGQLWALYTWRLVS